MQEIEFKTVLLGDSSKMVQVNFRCWKEQYHEEIR